MGNIWEATDKYVAIKIQILRSALKDGNAYKSGSLNGSK